MQFLLLFVFLDYQNNKKQNSVVMKIQIDQWLVEIQSITILIYPQYNSKFKYNNRRPRRRCSPDDDDHKKLVLVVASTSLIINK